MHVIVGQGQLDSILHATPEDRRGFIEEAAGVLKHRKRKEKALRKLDSTEGNLTRLSDLLTEIRRQLKPLGRQAEVARKAAVVQADVRDARARLLADDLVTARTALRAGDRRRDRPGRAPRARSRPRSPGCARPRRPSRRRSARTCRRCRGPRRPGSRCPGCASGSAAPSPWPPSGSATPPAAPTSPPTAADATPTELEAEAERVREQEHRITAEVDAQRAALDAAVDGRKAAEDAARRGGAPGRRPAARRRRPPRGPGPAARPGQRPASRAAAAEDEVGRLRQARAGGPDPASSAPSATSPPWRPGSPASTPARRGSTPSTRPPSAILDDLEERLAKTREEAQAADRERVALTARKEALELGLNRKDGAGALLAATDPVSGLLGSVAALLSVRTGYETAVAAALGSAADAVAVDRRRGRARRHRAPQGRRPRPRRDPARRLAGRRHRLARPARPRDVRRRRGGVPGRAAAGAAPAAVQGRRRRRPRRPRARWSPSCPT